MYSVAVRQVTFRNFVSGWSPLISLCYFALAVGVPTKPRRCPDITRIGRSPCPALSIPAVASGRHVAAVATAALAAIARLGCQVTAASQRLYELSRRWHGHHRRAPLIRLLHLNLLLPCWLYLRIASPDHPHAVPTSHEEPKQRWMVNARIADPIAPL